MRNKWGKGDPVNLADLLRITPLANEIMQISEEINIGTNDLLWIVSQIIDSNVDGDNASFEKLFGEEMSAMVNDEEWDELEFENLEESLRQGKYVVNVKINTNGRIPEIGFKAGINEKEDINYFFDMIVEMLEKLD